MKKYTKMLMTSAVVSLAMISGSAVAVPDDAVWEACAGAYNDAIEIGQCHLNVCNAYGCEP